MNGKDVTALAAVLFDMDGLLLDSERLWLEAEREVVHRLGGEWTVEHQKACVGGSLPRTTAYMLELTGADAAPADVAQWLLDGMSRLLREGVELLAGADELLDGLATAGVPCALVTSSYRPLVDAALASIGRDRFALTVAGDEVDQLKPAPDPYLDAARNLGADPSRCVALEDSPNGVLSAEAAGCVTVAVPSVLPVYPASTRTVVGSLKELSVDRLDVLVRDRACGPDEQRSGEGTA